MEESLLQLFRKSNVCVITVYGMKVCFWRIWRENNFTNGFQIFYVIPLSLCGFLDFICAEGPLMEFKFIMDCVTLILEIWLCVFGDGWLV